MRPTEEIYAELRKEAGALASDPNLTPFEKLMGLNRLTQDAGTEVMQGKNHDYTSGSVDPYQNFRSSTIVGVDPRAGILIRVLDKVARISTFLAKGKLEVAEEGFIDSVVDIRVYMTLILGLTLLDGDENPLTLEDIRRELIRLKQEVYNYNGDQEGGMTIAQLDRKREIEETERAVTLMFDHPRRSSYPNPIDAHKRY